MTTLREHLLSRGCNPDEYNVILDEGDNVATFLIYSLSGKLAGFQQYRPGREKNVTKARKEFAGGGKLDLRQLRYWTYCSEQALMMFGMDKFDWRKGPIYVVEGIFDCIAIQNTGRNALAIFGNNPVWLPAFREAVWQPLIAVCDDDPAGLDLAKYTDHFIVCPAGKDPAEMTPTELEDLLR